MTRQAEAAAAFPPPSKCLAGHETTGGRLYYAGNDPSLACACFGPSKYIEPLPMGRHKPRTFESPITPTTVPPVDP